MDGNLQFDFESLPGWQKKKQHILGSEYLIIEPNNGKNERQPTQLDFELHSTKPFLFGPMSKFQISGGFEMKEEGEGKDWVDVPVAEAAKVILAPNWLELLIKSIDIFTDNSRICTSNESKFIQPWLNCMLYRFMDPTAKKVLCPQPTHPAYCVPTLAKNNWTVASEEWKNYANLVFTSTNVAFDYIPLHFWPLFQNCNHMFNGQVPKAVMMPLVGKLLIRVTFHDNQDMIFRRIATNKSTYRFNFDKFKLVMEEAQLSYGFERSLMASKKLLGYPGVTRLQRAEPIPEGTPIYMSKFQQVYLPEGILVFALNKAVGSGQYSFAKSTGTNVFEDHQITSLEVSFDQKRFFFKEPHLGKFTDDALESLQYYQHIYQPLFGIAPDLNALTLDMVKEGGTASAYPHIYLPFTVFDSESKARIIPTLDDGTCLAKRADLDVVMQFGTNGSKANTIYIIYIFYTDCNLVFDCKTRMFFNPYGVVMN